ncbi:MAG: ARMT1-like domain-containing protein [Methanopyri archaeon]|jgi:hypothetical protein|nr:ARMT1-like domain-containing protein [Methanopyri archaeon]
MKLAEECIPCLMDRALFEARLASDNEDVHHKCQEEFGHWAQDNAQVGSKVAAEVGTRRFRTVVRLSGCPDPFQELKARSDEVAATLLPQVRSFIGRSGDERRSLVRVLCVGNAMDFGVADYAFDVNDFAEGFRELLTTPFGVDDTDELFERLDDAQWVLLILDNHGECVFDLLLTKRLMEAGIRVTTVAKGVPILNDVTVAEARTMGFPEVVSDGDSVGVNLDEADPAFIEALDEADVIVAKGMGNFETMSEFHERVEGRLVYLLKAKCAPVARALGVPRGCLVVKCL